jgi:hypothetical protein
MICQKHDVMLKFRPHDGSSKGTYFCPKCQDEQASQFKALLSNAPLPHGIDGEITDTEGKP